MQQAVVNELEGVLDVWKKLFQWTAEAKPYSGPEGHALWTLPNEHFLTSVVLGKFSCEIL